MAADPTIDQEAGEITLNFEEDTNYTLDKMRIGECLEVTGAAFLEVQSANVNVYEEFDGVNFNDPNWRFNDLLEFNDAQGKIGVAAAKVTNPSSGEKSAIAVLSNNPQPRTRFWVGWLYDSKDTNDEMAFVVRRGNLANSVAYGIFAIGSENVVAVDRWVWRRSSDANWINTGVQRAIGWHRVMMRTTGGLAGEDRFRGWQIWIDGVLVVDLSEVNGATTNNWTGFEVQAINPSFGQQWFMEELVWGDNIDDVFEQGTFQIDAIPEQMCQFTHFTLSEDKTGAWLGETLYQVAFTTDGGANYGTNAPNYDDGVFIELTNDNLQSFLPDQDGQDGVRIKGTHTPDSTIPHNSHIPRSKQLKLHFINTFDYPFYRFKQ